MQRTFPVSLAPTNFRLPSDMQPRTAPLYMTMTAVAAIVAFWVINYFLGAFPTKNDDSSEEWEAAFAPIQKKQSEKLARWFQEQSAKAIADSTRGAENTTGRLRYDFSDSICTKDFYDKNVIFLKTKQAENT